MNKIAIYHFTDGSEKRPIYCEKQIEELKHFASQFGSNIDVFLDKSLKKSEQTEREKLLGKIDDYDYLITKDFYHISKNTGMCMSILTELSRKDVRVCTIEDGRFLFQYAPFNERKNVVIYHSKFEEENHNRKTKRGNSVTVETNISIMELFIKKKTNWTITDIYTDVAEGQSDDKQVNLMKFIKSGNRQDILVCKDLNTIHWRTAKLCCRRNELKMDIYSLKEGFLPFGKEYV